MGTEKTGRNQQLDGLRGYAALAVAVYHTVLGVDLGLIDRVLSQRFSNLATLDLYDQLNWLVLRLSNGRIAVIIFFVLSGTVLFDSLRRSRQAFAKQSFPFLIRRIFRIYPALIVCILICAAVFPFAGIAVTAESLIENIALYSFRVNGATWTLAVEIIAAGLVLIAFAGYLLGKELGLIVAGVVIALLLEATDLSRSSIKGFWQYFLVGMLVPTRIGEFVAKILPAFSWPIILFVLFFLAGQTTEKICLGFLMALLYYRQDHSLGAFLRRPWSVTLGNISYSFYLYNVLFLEIICLYLRQHPWAMVHPLEAGLLASFLVVGFTIPVAFASMEWIEKPFIELGNRLTRGVATKSIAPSS